MSKLYYIETLGCAMNVHDSERIAGVMDELGYAHTEIVDEVYNADDGLYIINTCSVRENAADKLYGHLGILKTIKESHPGLKVAVGGCQAQNDKEYMAKRAPNKSVDIIFGTHNIGSIPKLLEAKKVALEKAKLAEKASEKASEKLSENSSDNNSSSSEIKSKRALKRLINTANKPQIEIIGELRDFPSYLPVSYDSPYSALVSISVGCNETCTYCIVPSVRGVEIDRPIAEVLDEIEGLVKSGVKEVTLLGQNVNAYGFKLSSNGEPVAPGVSPEDAFATLLSECGQFKDYTSKTGERGANGENLSLERVRFTSPHPAGFTPNVIKAMRDTPNIMPSLHMPLQSGSDSVLKAMKRSYRSRIFLEKIEMIRSVIPNIAITTDIIVGFPGETEEDFQATLDVLKKVQFTFAYTFQYSIRPGTIAGDMVDQIPHDIVQRRFDELLKLQNEITYKGQLDQIDKIHKVLVDKQGGKKDSANQRLKGRSEDGRLIHINNPDGIIKPGDIVEVKIVHAAPFHLIGDPV
ncbi:MAG: MiaB/RimO family radical SAM methylthiotransferase [Bifidobacteriaceae bacterium]|jgi:tRNA-2-methylthio-N6-dimethylallyladenosine synthase|nr:MiaB/RimO family radical SAM methylthiotransferase [Bifidobacteriaceae bacterium]